MAVHPAPAHGVLVPRRVRVSGLAEQRGALHRVALCARQHVSVCVVVGQLLARTLVYLRPNERGRFGGAGADGLGAALAVEASHGALVGRGEVPLVAEVGQLHGDLDKSVGADAQPLHDALAELRVGQDLRRARGYRRRRGLGRRTRNPMPGHAANL